MSDLVAVVPGDGVGREVVPATRRVLAAAAPDLRFEDGRAGDAVSDATGAALPAETRDLVARADATLFGAAGETAADVVLPLRRTVDSVLNVRPARAYPGTDPLAPAADVTILRENAEGVYAGHEGRLSEDVATTTRVITREGTRRFAEAACDWAAERGLEAVTVAHKANVMRETDGLFLDVVEAVAAERGLATEPVLMDALATALPMEPTAHEAILTPNLAGDVLSDLAAGLVGGLGLLPSANLGPEGGLFEPVHGTAPDIAGEGIANPTATILSGAMLLGDLGRETAADGVRTAVEDVLADGPRTPDLGGDATTEDVAGAVRERVEVAE